MPTKAFTKRNAGQRVKKILKILDQYNGIFQKELRETICEPRRWDALEKLIQSFVLSALSEFYLKKAPPSVIVHEYLEIANGFYDHHGKQLIHGLLAQLQNLPSVSANNLKPSKNPT